MFTLVHPDWKPDWPARWTIIGVAIIVGYYNYATWEFRKFKKLGVKGPKPIPLFGNLLQLQKKGFRKYDLELKQKYGSIVGCFAGRLPMLLVYDVQILKWILIKDFHLFTNHPYRDILEPPASEMVLFLKDDHWRRVRAILTPTFSGGKIKKMMPHLDRCCDTFCSNLQLRAEIGEVFDFRELCGAYTMDVIARTAFGIEIDSHNDPSNEFVVRAMAMSRFRITASLVVLMLFPPLYKLLNFFGLMTVTDRSSLKFFSNVVQKAVRGRKNESPTDKDFLQIMINAHLEGAEDGSSNSEGDARSQKGLTSDELLAQGLLFLSAGFETTANTLSLFGYKMATHPEIQERLHDEIIDKLGESEPTYESLKDLTFLEMCSAETLRMYPPGARTDRVASKDININGLFIPKGMLVVVPIHAIQNDPEYWEHPEAFNPDRFDPSVRLKIDPLRFMPFGVGPRNCVGMRLAILELKMAIVKMMRRFRFVACEETEVPLVLESFATKGKNGIMIKVEGRN